jgi:hypothetical protein
MKHSIDGVSRSDIEGNFIPAVPEPFWTTTGLSWWKRFNEKNWLPQCYQCQTKPIFKTRDEYDEHCREMLAVEK